MIPSPTVIVSARICSAISPRAEDRAERPAVRLGRNTALESASSRDWTRSPIRWSTRLEVERGRDLPPDLGEGGHLVAAAVRLPVEPGVLDRDADVRGDRRQEAGVGLAEPALLVVLWTLMAPIARSPTRIGTPRYDFDGVPTPRVPSASQSAVAVEQERLAACR